MQALSDDQHIRAVEAKVDRLETKVDEGFAGLRAQLLSSERSIRGEIIAARNDARADFRTVIGVMLAMWTATILAVVGVVLTRL